MSAIVRTDAKNPHFIALVQLLDDELAQRDGQLHSFYHQFNQLDQIQLAVVAYNEGVPVGCGALKRFDGQTMEIKRMFVLPEERGKGIATRILAELENWARELDCAKCVLETGKNQPEAIQLYLKCRYKPIPNYGQYVGIENSICFEKK